LSKSIPYDTLETGNILHVIKCVHFNFAIFHIIDILT